MGLGGRSGHGGRRFGHRGSEEERDGAVGDEHGGVRFECVLRAFVLLLLLRTDSEIFL